MERIFLELNLQPEVPLGLYAKTFPHETIDTAVGLPTSLGLSGLLGSGEPSNCTDWGSIGDPLKQSFLGTEVIGNVEVFGRQLLG